MSAGIVSNAVSARSDSGVESVRAATATAPVAQAAQAPPSQPDLRLNIVHDQESGLFVYKFVDPTSGQVVRQMPDQRLLELRRAAEYSAGRLISRKV